jgi:hypothetical protein
MNTKGTKQALVKHLVIMKTDKEYLVRVLKTGGMSSKIVGEYVVLDQLTPDGYTLSISERSKKDYEATVFEFWIQGDCAWLELPLPKPPEANAWLSNSVRWITSIMLNTPIEEIWKCMQFRHNTIHKKS